MNKEGEASGNDNNLENTERKDGDKNIELSRNAGQNVFDAGAKDTADQGTIEGKGEWECSWALLCSSFTKTKLKIVNFP